MNIYCFFIVQGAVLPKGESKIFVFNYLHLVGDSTPVPCQANLLPRRHVTSLCLLQQLRCLLLRQSCLCCCPVYLCVPCYCPSHSPSTLIITSILNNFFYREPQSSSCAERLTKSLDSVADNTRCAGKVEVVSTDTIAH